MVDTVVRWNTPACRSEIEKTKAGLTAQLIIDALLFRTHIFITRAFSHVGRPDDRHLRAAIEFLQRQYPLEGMLHPQDPERLKWAISAFESASQDSRLARLKKMRDKQLAHMASYDKEKGPTINDLFDMAKLASDIWENLAIGSATIFISVDVQLNAYKRSADIFWSKWDESRTTFDSDDDLLAGGGVIIGGGG
jgi:hypothetical protein